MCETCNAICDNIETIFGHRVDPNKLIDLIESSPLPPVEERRAFKQKMLDTARAQKQKEGGETE